MTDESSLMRILFATNHTYLPQRVGGSESFTHDLSLALGRMGLETAVLCEIDPRGCLGVRNRIIRNLRRRNKFPVDRVMGYPVFRGWVSSHGVGEVAGRFAPSVAVIQAGEPVPLCNAFLAAGFPTVLYIHDAEFDEMRGDLSLHPLLLFMTNSTFVAKRARALFGIESHVVHPLVLPERYQTNTTRERVVFICPWPEKGVEVVFRLAESRPDIPFEIVESWPLNDEMFRHYKTRAEAARNIHLRRRVLDMRSVYGHAKLLLVPSICEEAWGRVVTEAHMCGIPVLASNRGGLPESVGPGGILMDVDASIQEWGQALSRMWDDPAEYARLSDAALNYATRREIQPDHILTRFTDLIASHVSACSRQ